MQLLFNETESYLPGTLKEGMRRIQVHLLTSLNQKILDAAIAGIALRLAYELRFDWGIPANFKHQFWLILPAILLGRVLVNFAWGTYRQVWRHLGLSDAFEVARACFTFSVLLLGLRLGAPDGMADLRIPLSVILIELFLSLEGFLGVRALRRLFYEHRSAKAGGHRPATRVLLLGAGHAGASVLREIASQPGIMAVGFLDDDPEKIGRHIYGVRVLGPLSTLALAAGKHQVGEALICMARPPQSLVREVWATCDELGIRVRSIPTLEEILTGKTNIASFRDIEMRDLLGRNPVNQFPNEEDVFRAYSGKRILVTGAGGSIGSELSCQLSKLGPAQLVLLDKDENGLNDTCLRIEAEASATEISPVVADLRFRKRLESIFCAFRPEVVFHAAAHKHVYLMEVNPCEAILNNVASTRNLVEASVRQNVSHFVFISTDKAVRPTSIMGASKRVCEMIVQSRHRSGAKHFCCVRFGNVLGSRGSLIPILRKQIERGGPVTVTHPEVRRYLMTIPEAVCLLMQAGTLSRSGETFLLEMGEPVLIQTLARNLIELSGLRPGRDIQIEITHLRPGEKLNELLFDERHETVSRTAFDQIRAVQGPAFDPIWFSHKLEELEQAARESLSGSVNRILHELNIGFREERNASAEPMVVKSSSNAQRLNARALVPTLENLS